MKMIPDRSFSVQVTVGDIRPFRFAEGVFEIRWRDGRRRRALLAPANPLLPTAGEITEAVRSAYPEQRRPGVVIPDRAWARRSWGERLGPRHTKH